MKSASRWQSAAIIRKVDVYRFATSTFLLFFVAAGFCGASISVYNKAGSVAFIKKAVYPHSQREELSRPFAPPGSAGAEFLK